MVEDSTFQPFAGARCDIPPLRERTPSPVKKVEACPAAPPPPRDFEINLSSVDVIYAEDEEIFREMAIRELIKTGFNRDNIHVSENGLGALEDLAKLQVEGNATMPLVVILDVQMPGMDGRECALQIQMLVKKHLLRREPFVICLSCFHRQITFDEGKGNFQVTLPKPVTTAHFVECVEHIRNWWTMGTGRHLAAWKRFDMSQIDIISADDDPMGRIMSMTTFIEAGVIETCCEQASTEEELLSVLETAKDGDLKRPLLVILGKADWAPRIRAERHDRSKRDPFVICTSEDSHALGATGAAQLFHAFLPRTFTQANVEWVMELCRLWWLTRGEGPKSDSDSEKEEESEGEDEMEPESD